MNMDATDKRNLTYWWVPLLFGIIFLLTGLWILREPAENFERIIKIIGVIILVSGTTQILFTASNRKRIPGWGFQFTGGIIDLVIGIILVVYPSIFLKIITIFVGIWLIVNSIAIIMRAAEARQANKIYWKWELTLGIIFLLLAILFFWHPMILGSTIAIWTAMAFIILGVLKIAVTIRLKRQKSS